jgi:hypothetical protein
MVRIRGRTTPLTTVRSGRFVSASCLDGATLCCALAMAVQLKIAAANSKKFLRPKNEKRMTNLP